MLHSLNLITGASIIALDGAIGSVSDFLFDDLSWTIRFLVVDCGKWLRHHEVLITVMSVDQPDWNKKKLPVHLSKVQVRQSPDVDTVKPVSRQQEIATSEYYGWPSYWNALFPDGPYAADMEFPTRTGDDPHLRRAWNLAGYEVRSMEGRIGRLQDFVLDDATWHIGSLTVHAGSWMTGYDSLASTRAVKEISWVSRKIYLAEKWPPAAPRRSLRS